MTRYQPPIRDIRFVLHELLDVGRELQSMPRHAEFDLDLVDQVLEEGGRFASEVLAPLNAVGDSQGCTRHPDGSVTTPAGFKEAYRQYVADGWPSLACDPAVGGQGLPFFVNNAFGEMLNSANQAWTMYPLLSHGVYECLHEHGTSEQQNLYLPKLTSGEWTGTMCLTEPHCGSDLGMLRSKAEPLADGSYALSGTKIFISSGEHDLAENIIHLVLARLPDAPAGTKGISLFVVPKFLPFAGGGLAERNAIACGAIEHKMGIHGNATCVMNLDGARGWLVGEPNRGLNAMFVMMNGARLGVAVQSLGLTEVAYQNAVAYARERLQMRSASGPKLKDKPADPIIVHPDVRRMLLTQKAYVEAGRAFSYWLALLIDREHAHADAAVRKEASDLVALLTPIAKAFLTDNGLECTNLAMQVYGGHGFIWETGVEQFARDARINCIYEGTNGIQALDLLARKVLSDGGARLKLLGGLIQRFVEQESGRAEMREFIEPLMVLALDLVKLTEEIATKARQNPEEVGAAATPYLRAAGHVVFAWFWARMARIALNHAADDDGFYAAKLATARFYFSRLMPEARMQIRVARAGAASLMSLDAELF